MNEWNFQIITGRKNKHFKFHAKIVKWQVANIYLNDKVTFLDWYSHYYNFKDFL